MPPDTLPGEADLPPEHAYPAFTLVVTTLAGLSSAAHPPGMPPASIPPKP